VALLAAAGIFVIGNIGAIVAILSNVVYAGVLCLIIGAGVYVAMDKKARTLIWYGYQSVMRFITSWFVTIDPIGILKSYIRFLQENLEKMDRQIAVLGGQMANMKMTIEANEKEKNNSLKLAHEAQKQGKTDSLTLMTRKAGRKENSNITLRTLYTKMEVIYRVLSKMRDNAMIIIEDTTDEVNTREDEYKAMKAAHSAMKSALSIIDGNPDERALFEMSMEKTADQIGQQIGDMKHFMDISQKVMDTIDLQNGVMAEDGLKMLEEWEKNSSSVLLGADKNKLLTAAYDDNDVLLIGGTKDSREKAAVKSPKKESKNSGVFKI
jgi:hypothetical protein